MKVDYQNGFGKKYQIGFATIATPSGDHVSFNVVVTPIELDAPNVDGSFSVDVRCSGTLLRTWKVKKEDAAQKLGELTTYRVMLGLENEEFLDKEHFIVNLTSYDFDAGFEHSVTVIRKRIETQKGIHLKMTEQIYKSLQESSGQVVNMTREHAQWQDENGKETRGWLLQLATISAAEVAALVTIAPTAVKESLFTPHSIVLLVGTATFALIHVIETLQNNSLYVFNSYHSTQEIVEKQRQAAMRYLEAPSAKRLEEWTGDLANPTDTEKLKSTEIKTLKKDPALYLCIAFFLAGNAALAAIIIRF